MEKVNRVLEFVNRNDKVIEEVPVNAYSFMARTNDNHDVNLFVYKYNGQWIVNNDMGGNLKVIKPQNTRKDAAKMAEHVINTQATLEKLNGQIEKAKNIKAAYKRKATV